jgi:hypothetical protein
LSLNVLQGSNLGKAITYSLNQKTALNAFLIYGGTELSNNRAENAIRPFAVGRKNWLYSDTKRGAEASATIYSIIETAKLKQKIVGWVNYFKLADMKVLMKQLDEWLRHRIRKCYWK